VKILNNHLIVFLFKFFLFNNFKFFINNFTFFVFSLVFLIIFRWGLLF